MSDSIQNPMIYKAISDVMKDLVAVKKDKKSQQNYMYRSIDDVYNALNPAFAKNGVFIVPQILEQKKIDVGTTRNGTTQVQTICKIKFTFYAEDGSNIECITIGEGIDMGDKGTNKAMSIAYKYACFQVFCIPTEEMVDPDAESPVITKNVEKISESMFATIRAEQQRTGVNDKVILSQKFVTAKTISELTIDEFKALMAIFEKTPDKVKESEES